MIVPLKDSSLLRSHPAWDEWIEIQSLLNSSSCRLVSSRLGWVDWNNSRSSNSGTVLCSSLIPLGMSGLKCQNRWAVLRPERVSSRLGWVDWNWLNLDDGSYLLGSHPAWDEWIEMPYPSPPIRQRQRLIPLGMSGLKCYFGIQDVLQHRLIPLGMSGLKYGWTACSTQRGKGLIPLGMSGLKYRRIGRVSEESKSLIPLGMSGLK